MAFTALKPCNFAGTQFKIGDTIPDGMVLPEMAPRLIKMGKIAETPKASAPEPKDKEPASEPEPNGNDTNNKPEQEAAPKPPSAKPRSKKSGDA